MLEKHIARKKLLHKALLWASIVNLFLATTYIGIVCFQIPSFKYVLIGVILSVITGTSILCVDSSRFLKRFGEDVYDFPILIYFFIIGLGCLIFMLLEIL